MQKKLLDQFNAEGWVYLFLIAHCFLWTLVPALVRYNLPLDAIEGTIWAHQLQWGYDKDPFLNGWLTAFAIYLDGYSGWMLYFFCQVCVTASLWVVWQLGKTMLTPAYALVSVFVLEGAQYYNFHAIDFNDNTLELGLWALTLYFFYKALSRPSHLSWMLTGLFAGLCMMAKYYTAALLAAMALFLFMRKENRQQLLTVSPYLGLLIFIGIISPHIIWLFSHDFMTVKYVMLRAANDPHWSNYLIYPSQFIWQQLQVFLPILAIFGLLFLGKKPRLAQPALVISSFDRAFLFYIGLGPLLLTALLSLLSGITLRAGWGMPLLSLCSILLFVYIQPRLSRKKLHLFIGGMFSLTALLLGGYIFSLTHSTSTSSANFPGKEIAQTVTQLWQDKFHSKLSYVAGSRWVGGNISFYSADHPAVFVQWKTDRSPWIATKDLKKKGAVFVWDITEGETLPKAVLKQYPQLGKPVVLSFEWHRNRYRLAGQKIGIAFLAPG